MKRFSIMILFLVGLFIVSAFIAFEPLYFAFGLLVVLIAVGIYDSLQIKHTVLRNFPIIGHIRYLFELIRPEIQQYFIFDNQHERPFNRETRSLIYQRAKGTRDTMPFGTQHNIDEPGYESIRHSLSPTVLSENDAQILVGGDDCTQPYNASRLNVSAMSYGALSKNAIMALNKGAKLGNFAHNTGEGGLTPHHLFGGGDLIMQIGTAYFGCRNKQDGTFDEQKFIEKAHLEQVKMIEIKLSQGAKPSHGGVLPAVKISNEIAEIRGIHLGKDCVSPPTHSTFSTPIGLLEFVAKLRKLSGGKPVGFKLCIGNPSEFLSICKAMQQTNILPDFITVDGAEGGTGAAPVEFSNRLGSPINDALIFIHNSLRGFNLRDKIRIIASGKIANGVDMIIKLALGADLCNSARGMMFALGCIQSLQCNANTCPTGVTTQNPRLFRGLVVEDKYVRVANYHKAMIESCLELAGAMGINQLADLNPSYIFHRSDFARTVSYADLYYVIENGAFLGDDYPELYRKLLDQASTERF